MIAREDLLQHFIFHKSLLDEDNSGSRIDDYINILQGVEDGVYSQISDPLERTAGTVFELVAQEGLDPWDIDLAQFCMAYRKHLKKSDTVDFITAGRLSFLAWTILADKTSSLKDRAEEPPEIMDDFLFDMDCAPWELFAPEDPFQCITDKILENPPLKSTIRHEEKRRVGLVDLLDAFGEAQSEADLLAEVHKVRERLRSQQKPKPDIAGKLHKENLEEDIEVAWRALSSINKDIITTDDLFIRDKGDYVTVFVALLFLSREGKIELKQRNFPRGKITIKVLVPYEEREALMEIGNIENQHAHPEVTKEHGHETEEQILVTA